MRSIIRIRDSAAQDAGQKLHKKLHSVRSVDILYVNHSTPKGEHPVKMHHLDVKMEGFNRIFFLQEILLQIGDEFW